MSQLENEVKKIGKKNYKVVQLTDDVHNQLKEYCNQKGFIMSSFVTTLIKRELKARSL